MLNRKEEYKEYLDKQSRVIEDIKDYGIKLITYLIDHRIALFEQINGIYHVISNEDCFDEDYLEKQIDSLLYYNELFFGDVIDRDKIEVIINHDYCNIIYNIDENLIQKSLMIRNYFNDDVDGPHTLSFRIKLEDFFNDDIRKIVDDAIDKLNIIHKKCIYHQNTLNIRKLYKKIESLGKYKNVKIDVNGKLYDLQNKITLDENKTPILHIYEQI